MKYLLLFCSLFLTVAATAQTIPNFTLPNVANNEAVSLESYASTGVAVVIFTSNVCPYDRYYKDRIKSLISIYAGKVSFVLVNSYIEPEEGIEQMKAVAGEWSVPYLADKDQNVLTLLNAHKSPEVFLLKNSGGKFAIIYSGSIDDNAQVAKDARQSYLKDAIDKTLAGQKVELINNRAMGCSIRRK